jgi:hypothetical protein
MQQPGGNVLPNVSLGHYTCSLPQRSRAEFEQSSGWESTPSVVCLLGCYVGAMAAFAKVDFGGVNTNPAIAEK